MHSIKIKLSIENSLEGYQHSEKISQILTARVPACHLDSQPASKPTEAMSRQHVAAVAIVPGTTIEAPVLLLHTVLWRTLLG